ncbi:hypothetical protein [Novosphingobium rosa]|uniref:hypothetical protein n=1 Tax=Novosphingobium rosa TaxID=76978 RepID=UPI000831D714|nr:hypothetical protein [Novosphingobium rosa]
MAGRRMSPAEVARRIDALDTLRLSRPLTDAEKAEADNLASRQYQRVYRQGGAFAIGERRRTAQRHARQAVVRHG